MPSVFSEGLGNALWNFLFWWHRRWFWCAEVTCVAVKQYCTPDFTENVLLVSLSSERDRKKQQKHALFPNLMFACVVGRIFSSFSTLVSLVWITLPDIHLVSKSSNCYSLNSPFLCKLEMVAAECRQTLTKK